MLERQHDDEERRRATLESNPLVREDGTMPSADELGAEFERFLASQIGEPSRDDEQASDSPADSVDDAVDYDVRGFDGADSGDAHDSEQSDDSSDSDASNGPDDSDDSDGPDNPGGRRPRRPWFRF